MYVCVCACVPDQESFLAEVVARLEDDGREEYELEDGRGEQNLLGRLLAEDGRHHDAQDHAQENQDRRLGNNVEMQLVVQKLVVSVCVGVCVCRVRVVCVSPTVPIMAPMKTVPHTTDMAIVSSCSLSSSASQ